MRSFYGPIALVLFGLGGAVGVLASSPRHGFGTLPVSSQGPSDSPPVSPGHEPVGADFLRQAFELRTAPTGEYSADKAAALYRLAMRRLEQSPQNASAMWETLQALAPEGDSATDRAKITEYLSHLVLFQDSFDESLLACACPDLFDELWQVQESLSKSLMIWRRRLAESLAAEVEALNQTLRTTPDSAVATLSAKLPALATAAIALIETGRRDEVDKAFDLVADDLSATHAEILQIAKRIESDAMKRRKLTLEGSAPEPALGDPGKIPTDGEAYAAGPTEKILKRIADFALILESDSVVAILEQVSRRNRSAGGEEVSWGASEIATMLTRARTQSQETQLLSYNLWALSQIELAPDSPDWEEILCRIDQGFLDPVVSSLFSNTYGELINEVKDPVERTRKARILVTAAGAPLSSF